MRCPWQRTIEREIHREDKEDLIIESQEFGDCLTDRCPFYSEKEIMPYGNWEKKGFCRRAEHCQKGT